MASPLSMHFLRLPIGTKSVRSEKKPAINTGTLHLSRLNKTQLKDHGPSKSYPYFEFAFLCYQPARCLSIGALPFGTSSFADQTAGKNGSSMVNPCDQTELNRVNLLVWVLHESARSFSVAVESLKLGGSAAALSNAWLGKDVHEWHKFIGHQVAIYALLKTAIEVEFLLSRARPNSPMPVQAILRKRLNMVEEYIEDQLRCRHEQLVNWFKLVELPRIAGFFIPLLKKWSMEYAGSGVAGIIIAISCCAAVGKLGPRHSVSPLSSSSIDGILVELMDLSYNLVSMDKLYILATEGGFEMDFLTHFGAKVLPSKTTEELEFWIGLAKNKLKVAFQEEPVISGMKIFQDEVRTESLAVLGLFAYLGRSTRLYLSKVGIKDVDELIGDFLSYLECGILFIYPEFSSISVYQLFMEIITDEIGWLELYPSQYSVCNQERKRSRQHPTQAEKEMILSAVFTVCYDVFSGFAHFSRSSLQPLDGELLEFLLRSQNLLAVCLEDYWAAYDRSCSELLKVAETIAPEPILTITTKSTTKLSPTLGAQQPTVLMAQEYLKNMSAPGPCIGKPASSGELNGMASLEDLPTRGTTSVLQQHQTLVRKYSAKLTSMSSDLCMGTQLLLIDVIACMELLLKQIRGHKVSKREKKKLKRTLQDIAALVPITILMILPVSAVGHAAILAVIKKYLPSMIPSPYTLERLDVAKQLERTKKMEVRLWRNLDDPSSKV